MSRKFERLREGLIMAYNVELKSEIHIIFNELQKKAENIISSSDTYKLASERIMDVVSSKVSAECEGYMIDLYSAFAAKIKEEDYFKDPGHLNAFYELNLRDDLDDKFHFEITSLDAYQKGIGFNEVNTLYAAVGAAAGTLAVGGLLKLAISGLVNVPFAVIIAGAFAAACAAYVSVPKKNKRDFLQTVNRFLVNLEQEILDWLTEIEIYFEDRVRTLYTAGNR